MDKTTINFAKGKAKPPMAAATLAAKKKAAPPAPVKPPKGPPGEREEAEESGNPGHGGKEPFELVGEAAEAAERGEDTSLEDAVAGEAPAEDGSPPAWATDTEKWRQAAEAVGLGQEGTADAFEEPGVVVAYLYKMMGGGVKGTEEVSPEGAGGEGGGMAAPGAAAAAVKAKQGLAGGAEGAEAPGLGGEGGGEDEEAVAEGIKQALESPDPDIQRLTVDYDPERDGNPPAWVADEATWERAKEAVDPEGEGARYDQPYAVVTHVYKKMKGGFK